MELKPGYKLTDIGILPDDWDVTTVGDQFSIQLGKMIDAEKNFGILKPYLGNSDVQWGRIITDQIGTVQLTSSDLTRFLLQEGDLLVCEGGEVGRAAIWRSQLPECYFQKALHRLRPLRGFNVPLMQNLLLHLTSRGKLANYVTQTSIAHLPKDKFLTVPIPLPPFPEQKAIAEALTDVDELMESLGQLIAKKRQVKQGAMQELLTGSYRLSGFDEKWQVRTVDELFHISGGVSASRNQLGLEGYCYLHYGDIHNSNKATVNVPREFALLPKLDIPLTKVSFASLLTDGDIVFVDASEDNEGASKHIVVVNPENIPFISGLHTIVAKSKSNELDPLFRRYCFKTPDVREQFQFYVVGTKVSGISKSNIRKIRLQIPSQPEQQAIASVLAEMDAELASLETKLAKALRIKQGMIQELLTGRVRLVHRESNVLQFPAEEKTKTTPKKGHNAAINEAVIISVLTKKFGSENYPLGRKRYTKLSYLFHRHAEGRTEGYLEKAAGPYNPSTKYKGAEKIALSNRYVRSHARDNFSGFVAAEKIAEAEGYFTKWYGGDSVLWLEQFRYKKNDELELLATVDMAMVKLRETGKQVSVESVKQYLHDAQEWKAKLGRSIFADEQIDMAIKWSEQLFELE